MKNDDKTAITSYSDRCLDDGTMLIAHDLEILVLVVEQGIRLADLDGRVRVGFAAQLLEELVDVIVVDVAGLAESLNARGGDVRRGLAQAGRNADASEAGTLRTARLH